MMVRCSQSFSHKGSPLPHLNEAVSHITASMCLQYPVWSLCFALYHARSVQPTRLLLSWAVLVKALCSGLAVC